MAARVAFTLFWVMAALDIVALTVGFPEWRWVAKPLLMALLVAYVLAQTRRATGPTWLLLSALGTAWLADIALLVPGTTAFLIGASLFAVTQLCYISVFVRLGALPSLTRRWPVPVLYGTVWLGAMVVLWPRVDGLGPMIALYGAVLVAMAAIAVGVNRWAAVGGFLFVVSDFLIGLGAGGVDAMGRSQAVMVTYVIAQFLIVQGCLSAMAPKASTVQSAPSARPGTTRPVS